MRLSIAEWHALSPSEQRELLEAQIDGGDRLADVEARLREVARVRLGWPPTLGERARDTR